MFRTLSLDSIFHMAMIFCNVARQMWSVAALGDNMDLSDDNVSILSPPHFLTFWNILHQQFGNSIQVGFWRLRIMNKTDGHHTKGMQNCSWKWCHLLCSNLRKSHLCLLERDVASLFFMNSKLILTSWIALPFKKDRKEHIYKSLPCACINWKGYGMEGEWSEHFGSKVWKYV